MATLTERAELRAAGRAGKLLAGVLGNGYTATDVGPALTCGEAGDLAEALTLLGFPSAASVLLDAHAAADDEGDAHYQGGEG